MGVVQGHIVTIGTCNLGRCDEWRHWTGTETEVVVRG